MAQAKFKLRRGTAATWTAENTKLLAGEPGLETDTGKIKIGNGVDFWSALPYYLNEPQTSALIQAAIDGAVLEGVPGPQGPPGADGTDGTNGADGADGEDGASAYEIAAANGFAGSESEWLASLVGPSGADGADGTDGLNYTGPTITVSDTAPSSPSVGDIWIDTSA